MSVRDNTAASLYRDVLGPRGGPKEVLRSSPRSEYITGVLEPKKSPPVQDPDADSKIEGESENGDGITGISPFIAEHEPSRLLDPTQLPKSMGISFIIESENPEEAFVDLCVTWSRYERTEKEPDDDGSSLWKRNPHGDPESLNAISKTAFKRGKRWKAGKGVSVFLNSVKLDEPDKYHVSVFLVNVTPLKTARPKNSDLVFQPQIRINCGEGVKLVPQTRMESEFMRGKGDLLYRDRPILAHGHMCSAVWNDIDPERPPGEGVEEFGGELPSPFAWTDREEFSPEIRQVFENPDVRTEFVPCYPVQTPKTGWNKEMGDRPLLSAEELSEIWDPGELTESLCPLVKGYRGWIKNRRKKIPDLAGEHRDAAKENMDEASKAAERIKEGIDLLEDDEESRLAFCFANKVMNLQHHWKTGNNLIWYPFQLAFILMNLPGIRDEFDPHRNVCDLLWFPTAGGKTEAYLGLAVFALALRRRLCRGDTFSGGGAGTGVLSRYTLRLLTIQQFRRTVSVMAACEKCRIQEVGGDGAVGWHPSRYKPRKSRWIWGRNRFSAGLWVGRSVTPNDLHGFQFRDSRNNLRRIPGALDILEGGGDTEGGEPAQILNCPCCGSVLAIPSAGLTPDPTGSQKIHLTVSGGDIYQFDGKSASKLLDENPVKIEVRKFNGDYFTLSLEILVKKRVGPERFDRWVQNELLTDYGNPECQCVRPSRPGYFIVKYTDVQGRSRSIDFEIFCSNPECELNNQRWAEKVPLRRGRNRIETSSASRGLEYQDVPEPFQASEDKTRSLGIPIPAYCVDDQVYGKCPSIVIATVDKLARLAYEPKAAALFGNVDHYHAHHGYYREGVPPGADYTGSEKLDHPQSPGSQDDLYVLVERLRRPDLIIQDELHLIEGPLGSMVGIYETAVDELSSRMEGEKRVGPKYVASTATISGGESQVRAIFNRKFSQFPPPGTDIDDNFFSKQKEPHPLESEPAGQLYMGIAAPGKGALTPLVRIWSRLFQHMQEEEAHEEVSEEEVDPFWTLVGYFNAIRELAGAESLYHQDIPERIRRIKSDGKRELNFPEVELSSRMNADELPGVLDQLDLSFPHTSTDAVFATSMFGTGVDVGRLSLMVVNGQPKTTSSYIQATGRIGRRRGGLVVTFLRSSRPRDLNHYEFFCGYHRNLQRFVEPVSSAPFSPRARERCLGPIATLLLRNSENIRKTLVPKEWAEEQRITGTEYLSNADRMADHRHGEEVKELPSLVEERAISQPRSRRPLRGELRREMKAELDRWAVCSRDLDQLAYSEPSVAHRPQLNVVLGDPPHDKIEGIEVVYKNSPNSLRDVEPTTRFG